MRKGQRGAREEEENSREKSQKAPRRIGEKEKSQRAPRRIGDREELPTPEELFAEYAPLILRTASKYLSNPEDCRECVNDTFLEFYKHPERYNPKKGTLAAYLAAIAGKKAISKWRKLRRAGGNLTLPPEEAEKLSGVGEGPGTAEDPAEQLAEKMDLEKALSALSAEELDLIRQKYYDGMSIREIADQMQVPYETVKKRHQRTLKKLRLMLLIITVLAVLAGCVFFLAKKAGIIPGYGEVTENAGTVYRLEEPVTVPVPGMEWEVRITTALYQGEYLTVHYHITDKEGHILSYEKLGTYLEVLGDSEEDDSHTVNFSTDNFLYVGPGHYYDFGPLETTYIGNQGPGYYDCWLAAYDDISSERREDGESYDTMTPVWQNDGLPAVLGEGEELTFTFAADLILTESESGTIWREGGESDYWSRQISQEKHRFETTLTLKAVLPEKLEDYTFEYDEESGGVLAMPYLQDGRLIVAIYPLNGEHGRIVTSLVSTGSYPDLADPLAKGEITAVAEDGTVLTGTLLGGTESDASLYSEWDFGPAEPGTYKLRIPYLLKNYDGGDRLNSAFVPFSLKRETVSGRTVTLGGFKIRVSNLTPIDWEDLLLGSSFQANAYYDVKDTAYYTDTERLWTFEVDAESPYPDETVVQLVCSAEHKNAYLFTISGDMKGTLDYDIPEDGHFKYLLSWKDADNRMNQNPLDTWGFRFYQSPYIESMASHSGGGIMTRWEHPIELEFTINEAAE